jgi:hypothetical protein
MSNTTKKIRKSNFVKEYKESNNSTGDAETEWNRLKSDCQKSIRDYLDKIKKNNAVKRVRNFEESEKLAKALENENNSGNEYNSGNFESIASNSDKPVIDPLLLDNYIISSDYKINNEGILDLSHYDVGEYKIKVTLKYKDILVNTYYNVYVKPIINYSQVEYSCNAFSNFKIESPIVSQLGGAYSLLNNTSTSENNDEILVNAVTGEILVNASTGKYAEEITDCSLEILFNQN